MATTSLNGPDYQFYADNDGIIIVNDFADVPGGRSLNVAGFAPRLVRQGHVIIVNDTTLECAPMPATEGGKSGVATFGALTAGTGYTNGVYENVPLIGGSGSGATATVTVSGAVVTALTVQKKGNGYKVGDVFTINAENVGGTGSGASRPVATVADYAGAYGALPAGYSYFGICKATQLAGFAGVGILRQGTVNYKACPFDMTAILSAVKAALPLIDFVQD